MLPEIALGWFLIGLLVTAVLISQHKWSGEKLKWDWYDYFVLVFVFTCWPWVLWICYKSYKNEVEWKNGNG